MFLYVFALIFNKVVLIVVVFYYFYEKYIINK